MKVPWEAKALYIIASLAMLAALLLGLFGEGALLNP